MNLHPDDLLNNDRYCIQRLLSNAGGIGIVYLATDHSFGDTVVIKQSRFNSVESLRANKHFRGLPEAELHVQLAILQADFEREAKLLSRLRHNALPRVRHYFKTDEGAQLLVMELIPGPDLDEFLQTTRPSLGQVLRWADQLLDALHYLHTQFEKPIIHRDIKPQNLKLLSNEQIVLLDFGLAKGSPSGASLPNISVPGGSPAYSPLEQAREQGTDARSDLYALAVTLHHLLTGQKPPAAALRAESVLSKQPDPLRPAHELNAQVPPAVSVVLQQAAALSRDERYPTAAAMREALRAAVRAAPMPQVVTPSAPEEPTIVRPKTVPPPEPKPRIVIPVTADRPQATPPAQPQSYVEDLGGGVKLEMVYIPGGSFLMGSNGHDREKPIHPVTLAPFWMGKYPLTQAQWKAVMGKKKWLGMADNNPSQFKGENLPVEWVMWEDAQKFCEAISQRTGRTYRLPSEAQWEYACRAGSTGAYCFGDDKELLGEYAWWGENSGDQTHPVGRKKPNAWGLYDMHGNVWEWCEDDLHDYKSAPRDGSAWASAPRGPNRVYRGGGCRNGSPVYCQSAHRNYDAPGGRYDCVGFRLARTLS